MEAFGPCLPNNRAGGDFIRLMLLLMQIFMLLLMLVSLLLLTLMLICHLYNLIWFAQMWIPLQMLMFMLICLPSQAVQWIF